MSNWPLLSSSRPRRVGYTSDDAPSVRFLPGVGVQGEWAELCDALPYDTAGVVLSYTSTAETRRQRLLLNLGRGAAGAERVVVEGLPGMWARYGPAVRTVALPLALPRGARLAVQAQQDAEAAELVSASALLIPAGPLMPQGWQATATYGIDTVNTGFVSLVRGYSDSARVEVVGATARRWSAIAALFSLGSGGGATVRAADSRCTVWEGPAGGERPLIDRVQWSSAGTSGAYDPHVAGPFPVPVPAGTRLSVSVGGPGGSTTPVSVGLLLFG